MEETSSTVAPSTPGNTKFFIMGEINERLVDLFMIPFAQSIDEQKQLVTGQVTIYLKGPGGYWDCCSSILSMMDVAKQSGVTVRTVVLGDVCSSTSMIAVSGSRGHRFVAPTAEHMIHFGWAPSEGESPVEMQRSAGYSKRYFKQVRRIYEDNCKIPNLDKHLQVDQFYVTAKQALRWKLADHPLEDLE